jgi:carbamoyl-phosphate synthase large subunit
VIATDITPLSPAVHVADRAYEVPLSTEDGYIDAIEALCERERVGLVVPTIDDELPVFAAAAHRLEQIGARVAVSPGDTTALCNDKLATCRHLLSQGVSAAPTWLPADVPADTPLPLFVKPRHGRGGVGAFPARTRAELDFFCGYVADAVVQTYLDGPEFTIDILAGRDGRPLAVVPRERVTVRAGVIDRGRTVRDSALIDLGIQCAAAIRFFGPINVQCRVVGGRPTVFEINPRFSGGIPLTIAAGVDVPAMLVRLALGERVQPHIGEFMADLWMTSYESSFFLSEAELRRLAPVPPSAVAEVA